MGKLHRFSRAACRPFAGYGRIGGWVLGWTLVSAASAFDPLAGDYSKDHPLDVRVVAYNHEGNFISDPSRDAAFNRILTALNPDIISFEEFPSSVSLAAITSRLNSILPISGGGSWQVHLGLLGGTRTVIASRFPLTLKRTDTIPTSSTRGVTIALADLPNADYAIDVYLLGVHLKCCGDPGGSEDQSRQKSADAIANWLGDARGVARPSGNNVVLPADTPMINLGDFNLVGGPQPENTLITGNIQNESTYGPDVKGDWDNSNMTDLTPADPFTGDTFTWQGSGTYPPSRLDRFFYTDSVVTVANAFILNTDTMTPAALAAAGLQAGDTLPDNTSDHLPIAMDLALGGSPECFDDPDCSDGVACTADTCDAGVCHNTPNHALCNDGQLCNGTETCNSSLGCQAGAPPSCNDGIFCTTDICDPAANGGTGACVHTPNSAVCDDGLFCNGAESCSAAFGCQLGTTPCDDGVTCTTDSCNEATNSCSHIPNNSLCQDALFCNGAEQCDLALGCRPGTPVDCDDGVGCTVDQCDELFNTCFNNPVNANCNDSLPCNGVETCDPELGCQPGMPVNCDDGVGCTVDGCNETTGACENVPNDALCDNGLFCDGAETCDVLLGCLPGAYPCGGSGCDEVADACAGCVNDADCADGDICTWDRCLSNTCSNASNRYGDVDHSGFITLADLFCVLSGFEGVFDRCTFADVDVHPCTGNAVISLLDLFAVLDAFGGVDPCCG